MLRTAAYRPALSEPHSPRQQSWSISSRPVGIHRHCRGHSAMYRGFCCTPTLHHPRGLAVLCRRPGFIFVNCQVMKKSPRPRGLPTALAVALGPTRHIEWFGAFCCAPRREVGVPLIVHHALRAFLLPISFHRSRSRLTMGCFPPFYTAKLLRPPRIANTSRIARQSSLRSAFRHFACTNVTGIFVRIV